jgi:ParB family chromosome partitioning protein
VRNGDTDALAAIDGPLMTVAELDALRLRSGQALPPGSSSPASIEETLRAHGWTWSQEQNRGQDGYRFHNTKTFEVCWYPSLDARLAADSRQPECYERIAAGWAPPPLEGGTFTRPPGLAEYAAIPLAWVDRGRYQPRETFDQAELDELADSIREHGVITPIVVFVNERGRYELIAGERRVRAARTVGLVEVPARIVEADLPSIHELSLFENIQRENLSPIEEGKGFERIIQELGISEAELARKLGKNRAYIQQRRAIATAAPEVIAALSENAITFSQARAIAQAAPGEEKAQKQALTKVRELTNQGKRVTEHEARAAAEKVILKTRKLALEALGWKVEEAYAYTLIYAQGERPRVWTGAEILEAIETSRRPAGGEAPGQASAADMEAVRMRYKVSNHYAWIDSR